MAWGHRNYRTKQFYRPMLYVVIIGNSNDNMNPLEEK